MTADEINRAIAEACGWVWYRMPNTRSDDRVYRTLFHPAVHELEQSPEWLVRADGTERICNMEYMHREGLVPDYCSDLNAMHEAEKTLTKVTEYEHWLIAVTKERYHSRATAAQRAEAFLRTLGKWKGVAETLETCDTPHKET